MGSLGEKDTGGSGRRHGSRDARLFVGAHVDSVVGPTIGSRASRTRSGYKELPRAPGFQLFRSGGRCIRRDSRRRSHRPSRRTASRSIAAHRDPRRGRSRPPCNRWSVRSDRDRPASSAGIPPGTTSDTPRRRRWRRPHRFPGCNADPRRTDCRAWREIGRGSSARRWLHSGRWSRCTLKSCSSRRAARGRRCVSRLGRSPLPSGSCRRSSDRKRRRRPPPRATWPASYLPDSVSPLAFYREQLSRTSERTSADGTRARFGLRPPRYANWRHGSCIDLTRPNDDDADYERSFFGCPL